MGWIRVSDDFYDNAKMFAAGSIGRDMYWHGIAFCNRNLTDGLIPKGRALTLVDFSDTAVLTSNFGGVDGQDCAPIAVSNLLDAGLWHEDGHGCPDCLQPGPRNYVVHDYLKYQPSRAEVEAKAEATRQRVARFKANRKTEQDGNAVSNAVSNALKTVEVTREKHATPNPTPNPNPKKRSSVVTLGRGSGGNPSNTVATTNRGTRLPDDWEPPADVVAQMRSDHPHINLQSEHAKFCDYWHAKTGQNATKLDWNGTWRNWIRRASEQNPRTPNGQQLTGADKKATDWLILGRQPQPTKELPC